MMNRPANNDNVHTRRLNAVKIDMMRCVVLCGTRCRHIGINTAHSGVGECGCVCLGYAHQCESFGKQAAQ
jgi:hypothetical protein